MLNCAKRDEKIGLLHITIDSRPSAEIYTFNVRYSINFI
jgi:hypothetical protein